VISESASFSTTLVPGPVPTHFHVVSTRPVLRACCLFRIQHAHEHGVAISSGKGWPTTPSGPFANDSLAAGVVGIVLNSATLCTGEHFVTDLGNRPPRLGSAESPLHA